MIEILGIPIRLYGVCIALGILAATQVSAYISRQADIDESVLWDGLGWIVLGAVVGARAYHVIDFWSYYSQYPQDIIAVWKGGLGIFGAVIVGAGTFWLYTKYKQLDFKVSLKLYDIFAIGIPLGQAIGRWGNYFNQELYGPPSSLPWAIYISPEYRLSGYEQFDRFQPLFLYESLLNFGLFLLLFWIYKKSFWRLGSLAYVGLYLAGYAAIRFLLEFIRLESWQLGGVATAQLISGGLFVIGLGLILREQSKNVRQS